MADDYASHRRFHVYAPPGEGAGAGDTGALTDVEAAKSVVAFTWPEFAEVRLFPRDDFHPTPFERAFSSLILGAGHGAAPIVDPTGVVFMYLGWFDWSTFRIPTDMLDAFEASDDRRFIGEFELSEQWKGQIFISSVEPRPGMSDPMFGSGEETRYLVLTTHDGTVLQFLKAEATAEITTTFQPGDFLAPWIAGLFSALRLAILEYLAEDTIAELGTGRLVGAVSHDEMIFHLNRIEANSAELVRLRAAQALNGSRLQQEMRGIWNAWAEEGRQVQYLPTREMVARGVDAKNLISLRPFAGNPRGLALINSMLIDPGFERQFFEQTVHEMVADALGWSGTGGEAEMAFVGAEYNSATNTAQALLEFSIKLGRSIEDLVNALR